MLPHLRPHVLSFLRTELEALERNYHQVGRVGRIGQRQHSYSYPWTEHPFLTEEMTNVWIPIEYVESGHLP